MTARGLKFFHYCFLGCIMLALLQRVTKATVQSNGETLGSIDRGLLIFLGFEKDDKKESVLKLVSKILKFRIFSDAEDKMNLSVRDIKGSILVVSQFTLAANTKDGNRPSFDTALKPVLAKEYYEFFLEELNKSGLHIEQGQFGADMQVSLMNDGPVTFILKY